MLGTVRCAKLTPTPASKFEPMPNRYSPPKMALLKSFTSKSSGCWFCRSFSSTSSSTRESSPLRAKYPIEKFRVWLLSDEDELTCRICALAAAGASRMASAITANIRLVIYLSLPNVTGNVQLSRFASEHVECHPDCRVFNDVAAALSYGQVRASAFVTTVARGYGRAPERWRDEAERMISTMRSWIRAFDAITS